MREIKFRAFSKEDGKMYYLGDDGGMHFHLGWTSWTFHASGSSNIPCGTWGFPDDSDILMQYTGLKDKNGKEIYEYDLLRRTYPAGYTIYEVRFGEYDNGECPSDYDGGYGWFLKKAYAVHNGKEEDILAEDVYGMGSDSYYQDGAEVIGNIYENPEFLPAQEVEDEG